MTYDAARALELLRSGSGRPDAAFRDDQEAAICHLVEGRGRLLVVQKTGWGKSFVYFIATRLLREAGFGPALLVSPLLALMRNQIAAAERMGLSAATINSDNPEDWSDIEARLARGEIDILLVSPERLANERFRSEVLDDIAARVSLLVIDEAHCISDWGHDFRPHYRLLERIVRRLPADLRLLATTATANDRVTADLSGVLGPNLMVSRGPLNRGSLTLQTIRLRSQAERLAWLAAALRRLPGHGIVYTLTISDAEQVAAWLTSRGFEVAAYSGQTGDGRADLEQALLDNRLKALVATTALGMGYDKPDLAFVIHYQKPASVVAYYQQVGRAGRALDAAYGVLLSGEEEDDINDWFIRSAFPTREEARTVLDALAAEPEGLSVPALLGRVNLGKGRIERAIALMSLEEPAPIVRQASRWQVTGAPLGEAFWARAERLTALRREEQQQMRDYVAQPFGAHMSFLIAALDGDPTLADPPALPALPDHVEPDLVEAAIAFLRRSDLPLEPRLQWPAGGLPRQRLSGRIQPGLRAEPGRIMSIWGDAGWGSEVRRGKLHDRRFADTLVEAAAALVRDWAPEPAPAWVTAVPSLRHPDLVPDFAARLAASLGLPFRMVLKRTAERPEQRRMANATQQALNVDGALAAAGEPIPEGPVLLVDDTVESRWTLTLAAWALRKQGCGPVLPFALARTGRD
ncbi:ATP-dependent DNA helicase RecQ [bacterium YEK0313]|nr:ATP-dependent DNA helicase RecQ [bacterium YEK0313]